MSVEHVGHQPSSSPNMRRRSESRRSESRRSEVSFSGRNPNDGYVDDFGYWRSYEWTDYFERIFNTRNKDVKMRMYMAMQVAK